MSESSREQFLEEVMKVARARFPLAKVIRGEQSFSLRINGHIASLENLYRITSLRPDDFQHNVERWMVELLRAGEGSPDQAGGFAELKERILPMVLSEAATDIQTQAMITQPLVANLLIAYAIDHDRTIAYIPRPRFEEWGISIDELHETALANLIGRSQAINAHAAQDEDGRINLILFQTMDGYDSSRVLLPTLHDRLREHLGSPFGAAIPNRDILLCFRNDDQTLERMREQIANDYRQMPHQVSEQLLLVTPDGLAPHIPE